MLSYGEIAGMKGIVWLRLIREFRLSPCLSRRERGVFVIVYALRDDGVELGVVVDEDERFVVRVHGDGTEEAHQVREGELVQHAFVVDGVPDLFGLVVLHLLEFFVDCVLDDEPCDEGFGFLPEAEHAAECWDLIQYLLLMHGE